MFREVFNDAIVPGTVDRRIFLPDQEGDEDWGPSTAILAHFGSGGRDPDFQWRPDAIKIIVPISDEGPSQGDGPVLRVVHRAEIVRGLPDLCAEHAQQDLLLVGHAVGNRDGELLALEGGQGRQGDGRVARGCFDQLPSGELFPGAQPFEQVAGGAVPLGPAAVGKGAHELLLCQAASARWAWLVAVAWRASSSRMQRKTASLMRRRRARMASVLVSPASVRFSR